MSWHDLAELQTYLSSQGIVTVPARIGDDGRHHPAVFEWSRRTESVPVVPASQGLSVIAGDASRCVVIDIDPRNGGDETWERLGWEIPETLTVRTPGGVHYYLRLPDGVYVGKRVHGAGPGVDLLGSGSAPTIAGTRPDGSTYHVDRAPLALLPVELLPAMPHTSSARSRTVADPPLDPSMCQETSDLAQVLREACEAGERIAVLTALRKLTRAGVDGHTGLRTAMTMAASWYVEGRRALSDRDGKVRHGIGEDYVRMCSTVLEGAVFPKSSDPCAARDLLRSFGF